MRLSMCAKQAPLVDTNAKEQILLWDSDWSEMPCLDWVDNFTGHLSHSIKILSHHVDLA